MEVYSTEQSYVEALRILAEVFIKNVKTDSRQGGPLFGEIDNVAVKSVFSEIETLLGYSKSLMEDLKEKMEKWSENSSLGDVFVKLAPGFKIYTTYINTYQERMDALNNLLATKPKFKKWVQDQHDNPIIAKKKLKLKDFLLTPVQRSKTVLYSFSTLFLSTSCFTQHFNLDMPAFSSQFIFMQ